MSTTTERIHGTISGQAVLLAELLQVVVEPSLKAEGLSVSLFEMLSAIQSANGRSSQAQIAARLRVTPPTLCEAVKSAVRDGWVLQQPDPHDKRSKVLVLTQKSRVALSRATNYMSEAEVTMTSGISEEALATATNVLTQAIKNLARHDADRSKTR